MRRIIEAVDRHMNAAGCAIYLKRDAYRAEASSYDSPAESIALDDALTVRLRSSVGPADPRALHSAAAGTVAFPMMAGGELVGFLSLTPRREEYEEEDRQTLAAVAEAAGLALVALDPRLRTHNGVATNNLPVGLPALIGRDEELAELKALLEQARLVTLTGAGGIGKTRIALQVAGDMPAAADGAWFVDLARIDDPALVPSAIANVFDIADEGGARPLIDRVGAALKGKRPLILLDNCEHVIAAAAAAAERLLRDCPGVKILATSREPLGIAGEEPYRLPMLPVPPAGEPMTAERVLQYGAAALFVARAHTARRSFTLSDDNAAVVADIVRRLDGIALAIELAAPRINVLSLEQLTQRLDERFRLLSGGGRTSQPRHQTLHALIGWSYDLLSEAEQSLLRRCAIFRGGWTLEAAEAICLDERFLGWNVLDLLSSLVDKSLVIFDGESGNQRYRLLESTRQFAAARLDEAAEREEVAARHGACFARLAELAGNTYWRTDSDVWTASVRRDLENFRAAIDWGLGGKGDVAAAATIVGSLRWFWYSTARREGRALRERVTAALDAATPSRARGVLNLAAAVLDSSAQSLAPASEAVSALSGGGDAVGRVEALALKGTALGWSGRVADAVALYGEALAAARATQTPRLLGWLLNMVAYWTSEAGDRTRARALFEEADAILRPCNDPWQLARLQVHRAEFLFAEGDAAGALAGVREAQAIFRARNADSGLCVAVLNATAYQLALERFDEAWSSAREGLELGLRLDSTITVAWAIDHLARLAVEAGDSVRAARLLGYSDAVYREADNERALTERLAYERALELIRSALPKERVGALMAEGAALQQDAATAEALAIPQPLAAQTA
ncbi:MAG TPA: GAF domain-containing protein, partial [Candidatus Baltobacteraceae bacterium]|nr:GAF domain-containing protein [Candidatus Baltobacteraceae bacterium]